jgi:outer membrane protein
MKKRIVLLFITPLLFLSVNSFSQVTYKFGHTNISDLIPKMAEYDSAQLKLQKYIKTIQDRSEQMQVELNKKYQAYLVKKDSLTDIIKQSNESELNEMNQRIQQFNENAKQDVQKQQAQLLQPIYDKVTKTIEDIAKENKLIYVFDTPQGGVILYHSSESLDLTPLVKKKLGIKK